jgi:TRAP-type mannitol/chloroaromatic compound transport system permease small subunit
VSKFSEKYVSTIDNFTEKLGWLSQILTMIVVVIGFMNVVLRYVGFIIGIRLTSNLIIELQWYLYSLVFVFSFAYILKHNINVRVDFLYGQWPKRRQVWVDFIGNFFFLIPFLILGSYIAWPAILQSWGLRPGGHWGPMEWSPDPSGLPRAPIKTMIIFGFMTLLLQAISDQVKYWWFLRGKTDEEILKEQEHDAPLRIE